MNSRRQIFFIIAILIALLAIFLLFNLGADDENKLNNNQTPNNSDTSDGSESGNENVAALASETNPALTGQANRAYENGMYTFGLRVQGLTAPTGAGFYQVFLRKAGEDTISLGKLEVATSGEFAGSYVFGYQVEEDLGDYTNIVVSLEQTDDQQPEEILLEGRFE